MKKNLFAIVMIIELVLGIVLLGCDGDGTEGTDRERVTVTFKIGYEGGKSPEPISLFKGTAAGDRWPSNPSRLGWRFDRWRGDGRTINRTTVIEKDITVIGQWIELNGVVEQPSSEEIGFLFVYDPGDPDSFPAQLSDARKIWGMRNPIITFAYLADPVPMVFCHANPPCIKNSGDTEENWCDECVLYMYGSNDTLHFAQGNITSGGTTVLDGYPNTGDFSLTIQGLRVVSTKDLVNWTEHGMLNFVGKNSTHPLFPNTPRIVTYANDTWAPSAEWKYVDGKPRFFLYWCNAGNNTSVVVSDEGPIGPFHTGGLSSVMIPKAANINTNGVSWLFDPGTMIDSDGKTYMFLGGDGNNANPGNARRVQLADDLISLAGATQAVNLPWHFEATDIWKWKGIYYVNYTTNWSTSGNMGLSNIDIVYMMNREGPMATFPTNQNEWGGPKRILPNSTGSGDYGDNTNHASLFDYKGVPYMVYHTQSASRAYGGGRLRVAHITPINIAANGEIAFQNMGVSGAPQIGALNPYVVQEAETVAITAGVYTKYDETASNGIGIASIDTGDWMGVYGVDFGDSGARRFNAIVKLPVTEDNEEPYIGAIELRINPRHQGIANPANNTRLGTGAGNQARITGGDVIGRIRLEVKDKEDEGNWIVAWADLDEPLTGKHDLAFVFYSSRGASIESHVQQVIRDTDARARNVGFEIDQWWFTE